MASSYPIVYCSDGFCELTGYSRAQIMQKSCACDFLYGAKTEPANIDSIASALETKREIKLEVVFYKRSGEYFRSVVGPRQATDDPLTPLLPPRGQHSGTPFWCLLDIVPIQNEKHEVVLLLCSHKDITRQKLSHLHHAHHAHRHAQAQQGSTVAALAMQAANATGASDEACKQLQKASQSTLATANSQTELRDEHKQLGVCRDDSCCDFDARSFDIGADQFSSQCDSDSDCASGALRTNPNYVDGGDAPATRADGDTDKHTANLYSRRRSRAVLYQLSGHYGYGRINNMKSKLKLNNVSGGRDCACVRRQFPNWRQASERASLDLLLLVFILLLLGLCLKLARALNAICSLN